MTVPEIFIEFEWQRDVDGYHLKPAQEPLSRSAQPEEGATLVSSRVYLAVSRRQPQRIVRRGGQLQSYRPLERFDTLFHQFARDATSPEGVFGFVGRFGPLTKDGLDENCGEDVQIGISHAAEMRQLLDAYERHDTSDIAKVLGPKGKSLLDSPVSTIEVKLVFDPAENTPKLQFTVPNLVTALWFQLAQSLARGTILRKCQHCNTPFSAGPGATRRADAKFCSDAHRTVFNSLKRSKRSPSNA
jgi:hypothetical protein